MDDSRSLLSYPDVRRLAIAYGITSIGTTMAAVAIAYVAYRETESIVLTALVFSGNTLPFLFLTPLSGRLMTRYDLRHPLIALDVMKMAIWATVATLAALGELSYGLVLVGNFTYGSLAALGIAAWPRVSEAAAPPGRLPEVTAMFSTIPAGSAVAGALLGGR